MVWTQAVRLCTKNTGTNLVSRSRNGLHRLPMWCPLSSPNLKPLHTTPNVKHEGGSSNTSRTGVRPSTILASRLSTNAVSSPPSNSRSTSSKADKGLFQKVWDQYSISGQQNRIDRGEGLFRAAQFHAMDPSWYIQGRIPNEFRPRHAILTMHVWFLHKRLVLDKADPHTSLLIQDELFDILWNDTRTRIRAEGISELTVSKHLKDIQQITFQHCMHYDHAFTFDDPLKRREELALAIWTHVLMQSEDVYNDQLNRLALYVEWQYNNIISDLPINFFEQGRINWGDTPDFSQMKDNDGARLEEIVPSAEDNGMNLPSGWYTNITDSGDTYYWKEDTMESTWEKPSQ